VVLRGPSYHISISSLGPLFKYTTQSLTFNNTDSVFLAKQSTSALHCLFNSYTCLAGYHPFANPDIGLAKPIFRNTLLHFYCVLLIKYILQFIDICISILKIFDNSGKVETMQDTIVIENEPRPATDDFTSIGHKLLIAVIMVNLIVQVSIFLCA
jgi:hypothetical protein